MVNLPILRCQWARRRRLHRPETIATRPPQSETHKLYWSGVILQRADRQYEESATFEFGDEEDLATRADRLEIGGLVEGAVDRDGGFFFEVMAQARVELVHRLDDAAQVSGFDLKFAHAAGVAAAEAGGEDYARGHVQLLPTAIPSPTKPCGLGPLSPAVRARGLRTLTTRPLSRTAGE